MNGTHHLREELLGIRLTTKKILDEIAVLPSSTHSSRYYHETVQARLRDTIRSLDRVIDELKYYDNAVAKELDDDRSQR